MEFNTILKRLRNGDVPEGLTIEGQKLLRFISDRMHALLWLLLLLYLVKSGCFVIVYKYICIYVYIRHTWPCEWYKTIPTNDQARIKF